MTLAEYYELAVCGTRVFLVEEDVEVDGKVTYKHTELKIDQHTPCHLYDVVSFYAICDDLIEVVVER